MVAIQPTAVLTNIQPHANLIQSPKTTQGGPLQASCGPGSCTLPTWGQKGTYLTGPRIADLDSIDLRLCNIGALIRMGSWGPLHYNYNKEPPNSVGIY